MNTNFFTYNQVMLEHIGLHASKEKAQEWLDKTQHESEFHFGEDIAKTWIFGLDSVLARSSSDGYTKYAAAGPEKVVYVEEFKTFEEAQAYFIANIDKYEDGAVLIDEDTAATFINIIYDAMPELRLDDDDDPSSGPR
jgi:hypothetical protein